MKLEERHNVSHVQEWRKEGFTLIPNFFSTEEILPLIEDFHQLYQDRGKGEGVGTPLNKKEEGAIGAGHPKQFINIDSLPYNASSAINLIGNGRIGLHVLCLGGMLFVLQNVRGVPHSTGKLQIYLKDYFEWEMLLSGFLLVTPRRGDQPTQR